MQHHIYRLIKRKKYYIYTHGIKRGPRSRPFKSSPHSNSGLQAPPFQPLNVIVCKRFEPLLYSQTPSPAPTSTPPISHFNILYFSHTPCFWQYFSDIIAPMKYQINTKINSWQSYFLEDLKTKLNAFL